MSAHRARAAGLDDARRVLMVRSTIVVGLFVAIVMGVAGYVAASPPPFSVEEPSAGAVVSADEPVRASGRSGELVDGEPFLLAAAPGSGGTELYTLGERAAVDVAQGRWSASVTPGDAEVTTIVAVRADPTCGVQLAEMGADQGTGRFYGPLSDGCSVLATVPVEVGGR